MGLTRQEVAAMWLYHEDYVAQRAGVVEFYRGLSEFRKRTVRDMVREIIRAAESDDD